MSLTVLQFLLRFCKRKREHFILYTVTCPLVEQQGHTHKMLFRVTVHFTEHVGQGQEAAKHVIIFLFTASSKIQLPGSEPLKCTDMSQQIKTNLRLKSNIFLNNNNNLINFTCSLRSPPPHLHTTNKP